MTNDMNDEIPSAGDGAKHIENLTALLGPDRVKLGRAVTAFDPGFDASNLAAGLVALPRTTEQVSDLLRYCNETRLSVVAQGGRTGLSGAARSFEGQLILMMQAMAAIIAIDPVSQTVIVEAGCTLAALETAVRAHGLTCGIDLGARDTATIGGMIATNAGGQEAFRFGSMRQRVLGLEIVLPDGRVMGDVTQVIKANGGYDVKQLFIGSEGTLGIITRACLRLAPYDAEATTAFVAVHSIDDAIQLFRRLEASPHGRLLRAELMSAHHVQISAKDHGETALGILAGQRDCVIFEHSNEVLLEDELSRALEEERIADAFLCKNEKERAAVWKIREDWAVDRAFPRGLWFDLSVPLAHLGRYLDELAAGLQHYHSDFQLFFIGHLGDGNMHVTVNAKYPISEHYHAVSKLVYAGLSEKGGFFSAEHGIGIEKRDALMEQSDPVRLALMQDIKRLIDPKGIMNPNKIFLSAK
jgi:FAD/FMN-containing dehydrogenase